MVKTAESLVGEQIHIAVADGYAIYEVIRHGPRTCRLRWVEDPERNPDAYVALIGKEGSLATEQVEAMVGWAKMQRQSTVDSETWIESLEVGSKVHYCNGFEEYVRCEIVVGDDGHKRLLPVSLVGDWRSHDLRYDSYYVGHIKEGILMRPHASTIWEYPEAPCRDRGIDPRDRLPILLQEKPIVLSGTLRVTCGDINIEVPTHYDCSSGYTSIGPVVRNLLALLGEHGGYHAEVHTEDGKIRQFKGYNKGS